MQDSYANNMIYGEFLFYSPGALGHAMSVWTLWGLETRDKVSLYGEFHTYVTDPP